MATPVTVVDKNGVPVTVVTQNGQTIDFGAYVEKSTIDQPNGVAGLDASGKISTAQMPVGDVTYQGNWNASTNTPTLANGVGTQGDLHIVDVAGTQDLGGGSVAYGVGDWLIYDGAAWDRVAGHGPAPANPSVTAGLTAKNGTAATFMRSDAAPAIDQTIAPTWTGAHTFSQAMTTAAITASGAISSSASVAGNTTVTAGIGSNSVQMSGAPNSSDPKIEALGVTDANVSLQINAKGSGLVKVGSAMSVTGAATFNSNVNVAGTLGSSVNSNLPGPTNSGVTIGGASSWSIASFYDQARGANDRTMDILFINEGMKMRFANDARNAFLDFFSVNGGQGSGVTGIATTSGSGAWTHTGAFSATGAITAAGATLIGVVGSDAKLAQSANVNAPAAYAVTASGTYRVSTYVVMTRAATTSATLPGVSVSYTEATTGAAVADNASLSAAINQIGAHSGGSVVIQAQQGSNIGYLTSNYASTGATTMQYDVRVVIERLL